MLTRLTGSLGCACLAALLANCGINLRVPNDDPNGGSDGCAGGGSAGGGSAGGGSAGGGGAGNNGGAWSGVGGVAGTMPSMGGAGSVGKDPAGSGGTDSGAIGGDGAAGAGGARPTGEGGTSAGGEPGEGGAGGAHERETWCAISPWTDVPVPFLGPQGADIPAGGYDITYVSGAQIHDSRIGYEVTQHYVGAGGLPCGHHVFNGDSPGAGNVDVWLTEDGVVGWGGTIEEVEAGNRGHTWPLEHSGGPLYITLLDDAYDDNGGPGDFFCLVPVSSRVQ